MSAEKIIDTSKLGLREVEYIDTEAVPNPQTGLLELRQVKKTRMQEQPWLTAEEAKVLAGVTWTALPSGEGFMCVYNGRRLMCKTDPSLPKPAPLPSSTGQPSTGQPKVIVDDQSDEITVGDEVPVEPPKRKRGRPRKYE